MTITIFRLTAEIRHRQTKVQRSYFERSTKSFKEFIVEALAVYTFQKAELGKLLSKSNVG
jgi:hypothetical protein